LYIVLPLHGELKFLNNSQAAALQHPEYVHIPLRTTRCHLWHSIKTLTHAHSTMHIISDVLIVGVYRISVWLLQTQFPTTFSSRRSETEEQYW